MAAFSLTFPFLSLNASDVSSYVRSLTLDVAVEDVDTTASTSAAWKSGTAGLKSGSIQVEFNQDVAAGLLDSIMWPLLATTVAFEVRATGAVVGTSNPKWTGSCIITGWQPVAGAVGSAATISVTFPTTGIILRATA